MNYWFQEYFFHNTTQLPEAVIDGCSVKGPENLQKEENVCAGLSTLTQLQGLDLQLVKKRL